MNPHSGNEEQGPKIDWLGLARAHGRFALTVAVAVASVVLVAGYIYLKWGQASRTVASLEFRPTFASLAELEYPNGLPFSPNDVIAGPILDLVYDANSLGAPCDRDAFRAGFFVEQRSDQSVFLDLEYESRLTEPRITMVERRMLQEEHAAKRKALPFQYRLVFVAPAACTGLDSVVVRKAMVDVLSTWAAESEEKRGVLSLDVEVLTPGSLDVNVDVAGGLLLTADLLRTALQRITQNIEEVRELPGAALIRLGSEKVTFGEVQGKIIDLVGSRLDPLVMTSGRSMVKESPQWVTETVAMADRKREAAELKIEYYRDSLSAYSGGADAPASGASRSGSGTASGTGAAQGQTASIDESFVNRIVQLSEINVRFRQKLTDAMVAAQLDAVREAERASYYRGLLASLGRPSTDGDPSDLATRLDAIVKEGKRLTAQFVQLYDEFSRVALRSAAVMYETRKPVTIETSQQFKRRSLLNLVAIVFVGTLAVTFGFLAVRRRLRPEPH